MRKLEPTVLSMLVALATIPMSVCVSVCAQEDEVSPGYKHDVQITGKSGGPYNLKATVKPNTANVPMYKKEGAGAAAAAADAERDRRRQAFRRWMERSFDGSASDDVQMFDPLTTTVVNELVDSKGPLPATTMNPEDHHHEQGGGTEDHHNQASGGPEDHHALPTDGSPGSEDITNAAITTFYDNLPNDIVWRLSNMGTDPMATVHVAGDPYAPYAIAMNRGDFLSMRRLAQDDAIENLRQRIAMLGLAGAAALRNLGNPKTADTFPAKDTLRKLAEDLHYAGQGLDENKPGEAKLKATCEDISRVWSNMGQSKANK